MGSKTVSIDPQNTSPKEIIRRNIRHALSNKSPVKFPNIDISKELFDEVKEPADTFVKKFRENGGKFIPCDRSQFNEYLLKLLKSQRYNSIFCAEHSLARLLTDSQIPYMNTLLPNIPADAAIVYSDLLIARSGSIVFTQRYQLYPSIKNMASDIIVIAKIQNIVRDLKEALQIQMTRGLKNPVPFFEIITPTLPLDKENESGYSPSSPRYILFLVY